jgi:glycosyltransferase involved in cell wall biosynthesis
VQSVLTQPECLERLVADGGSTDGSLEMLENLASVDPRLRIISRSDAGPADAINKAFRAARGTLIGWLNADDLYAQGALARAVAALAAHPEWLMVYGEADHINASGDLLAAYPTQSPSAGLDAFRNGCFICQPSVVFRRALGVVMGPFNTTLKTAFDFDYWLRAFSSCPQRIGFIPSVQAYSRLHSDTITAAQRERVALEAMQLIDSHCGYAPSHWLLTLIEEQLNDQPAQIPSEPLDQQLQRLLKRVDPWMCAEDQQQLPQQLSALLEAHQKQQAGDWGDRSARSLLAMLRPELMQRFAAASDPEEAFFRYVLENGWREYPRLREDAPLLRDLIHQLDVNDCADIQPQLSLQPATPADVLPFQDRSFGVNLIGYVRGQLGIGEDLRSCAMALAAADVPTAIIDFPPGREIPQNDTTLVDQITSEGPYAFNLFCLTAEELARHLMERGQQQWLERWCIGYCPWELSRWPGPWRPLLGLVDELWASSRHTAAAMQEGLAAPNRAAVDPAPSVQQLPLPVALEAGLQPPLALARRQAIRRRHQLPADVVLFTFSFDLNSSIHRKNPLVALRAFQRAFPADHPLADRVALLIKTHPPARPSPEWNRLKQEATADPRLHTLETTLPRLELLELYAACDAFVSLHRAEGFGRGLAEALLLGLDVIATDHGGNTDFCTGPLAQPVRHQLIPVLNGEYVYHRGQTWAQASTAHAAALMQQVAQRRLEQGLPSQELVATYRERFDPAVCGARYRQRLETLWAQRDHLGAQLRWRQPELPRLLEL